jgi:hypothetical protein
LKFLSLFWFIITVLLTFGVVLLIIHVNIFSILIWLISLIVGLLRAFMLRFLGYFYILLRGHLGWSLGGELRCFMNLVAL